jgi:hypothetical protein
MKTIVFLIVLFCISFTLGCGQFELLFPPYQVLHIIKNDSNYDIEIRLKGNVNSIEIAKGKFYEQKKSLKSDFRVPFSTEIDSLAIIFNKERVLNQYCNGKPLYVFDKNKDSCKIMNNLMNSDNGIFKKINSRKVAHSITFTINNLDYERAIPLIK